MRNMLRYQHTKGFYYFFIFFPYHGCSTRFEIESDPNDWDDR